MISKLPKWIEVGAFVLAFIAGFINALGLLSFEHQSVSHISGSATLLGVSLTNLVAIDGIQLLGVLLSFLLGAIIAGGLLPGEYLKLGKHYEIALILEAVLLLIAFAFLKEGHSFGHFFASSACGLQNAMATRYSGAVIRTTHLTGIFTDIGIMLGAFFRGEALDIRKIKLFILIILGFVIGGIGGAKAYAYYYMHSLLIPVFMCLLLSAFYRIYQSLR